ncbi:MAG: hypothetical protein R3E32_28175 [Chitinophagales bacterium]
MHIHWQYVLKKIEEQYEIKNPSEWNDNNKAALKKLKDDIEGSVRNAILQNTDIAKKFIKDKRTNFFTLPLEKKQACLEKLISEGNVINFRLDERILMSKFEERKYPSQERIRNCFSIFIFNKLFRQFCQSNLQPIDTMTNKVEVESNRINQFNNTYWWVFYHHYEETSRTGKLGKAILNISDKNTVFLQNVETDTSTHYEGKIELEESNQHLYLDLRSIEGRGKHLRITVFKGIGKVYPIMIGVYTNIYSNNSMAAGSIVLEQIKNHFEEVFEANSFSFKEAQSNGVSPTIVQFLKERGQNYLKAPNSILTIDKLKEWLELQQKR